MSEFCQDSRSLTAYFSFGRTKGGQHEPASRCPLDVREADPALASFTDATHNARDDLAAGAFLAFATAPSQRTFATTAAGIQNQLVFTSNNPFSITLSAGSLSAHISGAHSVVNPAFAVGRQVDSTARPTVATSGGAGATYVAEYGHAVRRSS
jgi:hypothetical protein